MSSGGGSVRNKENSKLLVKWTSIDGVLTTELSHTNDISEDGISFYLKTQVWLDTHLTLTIGSSDLFGRLLTVTGKVVRIQTDPSGRQLVGVRFD